MTNIQFSSENASMKVLKQGSGSFNVASATSGSPQSTTATIAHGYGSDNLLWQVGFKIVFSGGGTTTGIITPWGSADGSTTVTSTLDSTNLYITGKAQTAGLATLAYTVTYYYRIFIP